MYDMDETIIISESFERLSMGEETLLVDHLIHGLKVNECTHTDDQYRLAVTMHLI